MEWKKATLFISSTFNDMHGERDYLVKEVFPELEDWAEKRKVHLTEVDLRWGITEEESRGKGTVGTCLRHIDKSRPFFICFLGQKIGWIPDFEKDINDKTKHRYPTLNDMVGENSLTEIEIEHSLFSPLPQIIEGETVECPPTQYNLFFFRKDNYTHHLNNAQREIYTNAGNPEYDEKLKNLKKRILKKQDEREVNVKVNEYLGKWDENLRQAELSVYGNLEDDGRLVDFRCGERPLKEVIIDELKEQISQAFPENYPIDHEWEIEKDNACQDIFIHKNNENYIERRNCVSKIMEYVENDERAPLLISSPSGYGKTMIVSKFINDFEEKYPAKKLIKRLCGMSNLTSDEYTLWTSIMDEVKISKDSEIYPRESDELKSNFKDMLNEIAKSGKCAIVIDSANLISNGHDMINQLYPLPNGLKVIISTTEDMKTVENEISQNSFSVSELDEGEKRDLIETYLKNYLKELDEKEIEAICKTEGSKNPLYLKILLSELRIFGLFSQLESQIRKFGQTPETAFNQVLERLEEDEKLKGKEEIVPKMFYHLSNSSKGLRENELTCLIKDETGLDEKYIQDTIRLFLRQVRQFMVKKEEKYDFSYESFKIAARNRYGK